MTLSFCIFFDFIFLYIFFEFLDLEAPASGPRSCFFFGKWRGGVYLRSWFQVWIKLTFEKGPEVAVWQCATRHTSLWPAPAGAARRPPHPSQDGEGPQRQHAGCPQAPVSRRFVPRWDPGKIFMSLIVNEHFFDCWIWRCAEMKGTR